MGSLPPDKYKQELLGANVEINIDAGLYKGSYSSRLEEINENEWQLAHPFLGQGLLPIYRNLDLTLSIKKGDALYVIKASVKGSTRTGQVPYLLVIPVGEAKKVQRRRFLRVPCLLDGILSPLSIEEGNGLPIWKKGVIKDISLGGVRFSVKSKDNLSLGISDKVILAMTMEGFRYFICCTIVMLRRDNDNSFVDMGVEFESIPGSMEKVFMHFIRQQELVSRDERI